MRLRGGGACTARSSRTSSSSSNSSGSRRGLLYNPEKCVECLWYFRLVVFLLCFIAKLLQPQTYTALSYWVPNVAFFFSFFYAKHKPKMPRPLEP